MWVVLCRTMVHQRGREAPITARARLISHYCAPSDRGRPPCGWAPGPDFSEGPRLLAVREGSRPLDAKPQVSRRKSGGGSEKWRRVATARASPGAAGAASGAPCRAWRPRVCGPGRDLGGRSRLQRGRVAGRPLDAKSQVSRPKRDGGIGKAIAAPRHGASQPRSGGRRGGPSKLCVARPRVESRLDFGGRRSRLLPGRDGGRPLDRKAVGESREAWWRIGQVGRRLACGGR